MIRRLSVFLLIVAVCGCRINSSSSQDEILAVRVEGPRISRTAFTNWETIELTYNVGYMDGYEPVWDDLKPGAMSFGVLELDPDFSKESDIRNKRKFGKENYFDIVYHLRYMADEKKELTIPGQRFSYRQIQSGNSEVRYDTTKEFKLVYNTVLTSDADDIKEEYDQGYYRNKAVGRKILGAVVVLLGLIGGFVILFSRLVPMALPKTSGDQKVPEAPFKVSDLTSVLASLRINIVEKNMELVCNGLHDVIRLYVPEIGPGVFSKDMTAFILVVPHEWERERLLRLGHTVQIIEDYLYSDRKGPEPDLTNLAATLEELRPDTVYKRRHVFNLKHRLMKLLSSPNRIIRRRK